jgi:hypothetical protein
MIDSNLKYKLSDEPGSFGLSCTTAGVTLAGVPLLQRVENRLLPRPVAQVRWLIDQAYRGEFDAAGLMSGLDLVARSLNDGEMTRAMIAAVLLKLPALDWNGAARIAHAEAALAKIGFNPAEPRDWRGRWTSGGGSGSQPANDHLHAPGRPNGFPHGRLLLLPPANGTDDADLLDIARNSDFHDEIRDALADQLRMSGLIVATEVNLSLDGTGIVARADVVAMKPGDPTTLSIVEIKTGPNSRLRDSQSWVYPGFVHGGIVSSPDPKIASFGFTTGQLLPPSAATIWYEESPASAVSLIRVKPIFPFIWHAP